MRIGSDLHKVFAVGLSAFDSKRWICDDGISAYAFGYVVLFDVNICVNEICVFLFV